MSGSQAMVLGDGAFVRRAVVSLRNLVLGALLAASTLVALVLGMSLLSGVALGAEPPE